MSGDLSRRAFIRTTAGVFGGSLVPLTSAGAAERGADDFLTLSIRAVGELIRRRKLSPVELTRAYLARIERLNPEFARTIRNTSPFNVFGWPTISIPCGFTASGLPIGLQISAAPGRDALVLQVAHAYEQATDWHRRTPNLV